MRKFSNEMSTVFLYVNDLIFTYSSSRPVDHEMMEEFDMTDHKSIHYFLGMDVPQIADDLVICQAKYAQDLLKCFNMDK